MTKKRTAKSKIGLEIEVNQITRNLRDKIDRSLWKTKDEHCGVELVSSPAEGAMQIRKLAKSIKSMGQHGDGVGFRNAGTHIHIDFCSNQHIDSSKLVRLSAKRLSDGSYDNPTGSGKRFFWITPDGSGVWRSRAHYNVHIANSADSPERVYTSRTHEDIVLSVKRFAVLGARFAPVLFALQHPIRRFNKYCHSIEGWNENQIMEQQTIKNLCNHPNLQQNHRRTMINFLSFKKFGTVEIRMLRASLNYKEIMAQLKMFLRMSHLAKSDIPLPNRGNSILTSFSNLMDACGIAGKSRRLLRSILVKNLDTHNFNCLCYHFSCQRIESSKSYKDFGLSRAVCRTCSVQYIHCSGCGQLRSRDYDIFYSTDDKREWCESCYINRDRYLAAERTLGGKYHFGILVGSGLDEYGNPNGLRRMHELFS